MSLLLLFHGAGVVAYTPKNEHYQQWSMGRIGRAVGLSTAIITSTLGNYPELPPSQVAAQASATTPDWASGIPTRPKQLSTAANSTGWMPAMPPRVPNREFQEGWRARFTDPPAYLKPPALSTAARDTSWWPAMPPRVPEVEYREGWRARWQEPPARLRLSTAISDTTAGVVWVPPPPAAVAAVVYGFTSQNVNYWPARRSPEHLGQVIWSPQPPAQVVQTYTDLVWGSFQGTPARAQLTAALRDSGWQPYMPPRVPETEFQDGWRHRWTDPPAHLQRQRSVHLLGQVVWPAQVPNVEFQDGWRQEFSRPVRLAPQPRLEGFVAWPGIGYSFVATQTPTELWWGPWQGPPAHLLSRRSQELLTSTGVAWAPQVPNVEYQEGWRSAFSTPPVLQAARRATNLIDGWPWPGYGFFFGGVPIAPTPTEWWYERWQNPPQLLQPRRSVELLSDVVTARVPDVQFQEGWRSEFSRPVRLSPPARPEGYVVWPGYGFVQVVFAEGWRAAFPVPPQLFQQARRQGFITAVFPGAPVTLSPGPWPTVPAGRFLTSRYRIDGWPWQAYQYTVAAVVPPPTDWWLTRWTEPPIARARAVYLRDDSWSSGPHPGFLFPPAPNQGWQQVGGFLLPHLFRVRPRLPGAIAWDPQFIFQVVPPLPPQCGSVTMHFAPMSSVRYRRVDAASVKVTTGLVASVRSARRRHCDPDEEI